MPLKRILTFDELQLVLQRFQRTTRRFAVSWLRTRLVLQEPFQLP